MFPLLPYVHWHLSISGESHPTWVSSTKNPGLLGPLPPKSSSLSLVRTTSHSAKQLVPGLNSVSIGASPIPNAHLSFSDHDRLPLLPQEHGGPSNTKLLNFTGAMLNPSSGLCSCTWKVSFSSRLLCLCLTFLLRLGTNSAFLDQHPLTSSGLDSSLVLPPLPAHTSSTAFMAWLYHCLFHVCLSLPGE